MKNLMKHVALVISFLAGLRLLVKELALTGLIGDGGLISGWMETFARVALTPLPISNFWVLVFSLSVLGILFLHGHTKRSSPKQIPWPPTLPRESVHEEQQPFTAPLSTDNRTIAKERVEEEWNSLEEADKETIREMVVQGGLWESDIIALLQVRGFLYHNARYDSLADRVSFVQCDYAGYHSILPEYHSLLESVLAADYAEDSLYETVAHENS